MGGGWIWARVQLGKKFLIYFYFLGRASDGRMVVLQGQNNFRDIGGYAAGVVALAQARCGSGGPSQRPGPPRRAQKRAGDDVSSARLLTKVHPQNVEMDGRAGQRGSCMPPAPCASLGVALAGPASGRDRPGGLRKGRGISFTRPGLLSYTTPASAGMPTASKHLLL